MRVVIRRLLTSWEPGLFWQLVSNVRRSTIATLTFVNLAVSGVLSPKDTYPINITRHPYAVSGYFSLDPEESLPCRKN